ncbi:integrin alpha pat-2-like protein, partial [Dinothrombium tinctorium]
PYASRRLKPILNKEIPNVLTREINIQKNCGEDNVCVPNLQVTVTPSTDRYLIGSGERLELRINITNKGEDAYEATLYLFMPLDISFININRSQLDLPISCTGAEPEKTGINVLKCDIGNPFMANKTRELTAILMPSKNVATSPDFFFMIIVNSSNPENINDTEDNKIPLGVRVDVEINLSSYGYSEPPLIYHNVQDPIRKAFSFESEIGEEVTHKYHIHNRGPSTVVEAKVTILWPSKTLSNKHLLYIMDDPKATDSEGLKTTKASCQTLTPDERDPLGFRRPLGIPSCGPTICTKIECKINNLSLGEQVVFSINSRLWKETVQEVGLEEFQISSRLVAQITRLPYNIDPRIIHKRPEIINVSTQVKLIGLVRSEPISLWIIILAICGGLLLLALLVFALWKLGFFERKRPPSAAGESEPLQSNGYNYRKGDTSL